ncbi:TolC family protein [Rufibacter psychrotolerans]|uniref:TolC family protein n=1 Tax=Rufibacter psychrotolerans TaxID=2812556 RepID=UPI0019683827|nr:TolC family protein [Rufibacter sp. SYSU D00308]
MSQVKRVTGAGRVLFWVALLGAALLTAPAVGQDTGAPVQEEQEDPNTRRLSLAEVIKMAREQSPSYQQALTQLENRTWQFQTYKSNYLPQLALYATLPSYTKDYERVTDPNTGEIRFVGVQSAVSSGHLELKQNIGLTGGVVSIDSKLQRIDNNGRHSYASNPVVVTIRQPIFNHNGLKWDRRTEPLRYEEAKRNFWEEMERIAVRATDLYFSQLQSQISYDIAQKNVANNDTLFKIAQARFYNAKISVNELLQLELSLLTSRQSLEQARLDIETTTLRLKTYLGITDTYPIRLVAPDQIPQFEVDEEMALKQARENRSRVIGIKREELDAERNLDWAEASSGVNADLFLQYGLTQRAESLGPVYEDPTSQQRINVGFSVPLMDWGRNKSRIGTAKANLKLVKANLEQQRVSFEQDVYLQVKRFKMLREQMKIAQQANGLAERRYLGAKDRYLNGKIGILDLNQAATERDSARRSYVSSLRNFWDAYYNLRLQTLYDFETNQPLTMPLPF